MHFVDCVNFSECKDNMVNVITKADQSTKHEQTYLSPAYCCMKVFQPKNQEQNSNNRCNSNTGKCYYKINQLDSS